MTGAVMTCTACKATGSGRYCSSCGQPYAAQDCANCRSALAPQAKFCPACGAVAAGAARTANRAWLVAGGGVLALLVGMALLARGEVRAPAPPPAAAEAGGATPPDISQMSPRERFDRLYDRSMRASESGDTATVARFAPMALLAYQQLDSIDADARYHAALLRLHTGDIAGASALGDSILAMAPGHLLGYVIAATVARWRHDQPATDAAYAGFRSHYDAEMRSPRPEYAAHKMIMDDMHQRAIAPAPVPARQ